MPGWGDLLAALQARASDAERTQWMNRALQDALATISRRRGGRNVLFYASAFLQKPAAPAETLMITAEEINGFMATVIGFDWTRGLSLVLHTPGGVTNAAESLVGYLWSKFPDIEVLVPTYAMSAGTMIALASNRIVMGRQSQLGPIDPQLPLGARSVSARAVVDQFERAKAEVVADVRTAHAWAPILQTVGPALLREAENALAYGESMVARWLREHMLANRPHPGRTAKRIARHFNDAAKHRSHGRRIDRTEAASCGVVIEELEADPELQDAVLTAYHLVTISFEKSPASKIVLGSNGRQWVKNLAVPPSGAPR